MSALRRRLAGNPLPDGAVSVGIGLVVGGLSQYGFLSVATHALGTTGSAPLATFWALLFICGPGFFLPLEQEVGRALAARRARGAGGRPVVAKAAVAGGTLAALLMVAAAAAAGPISARLFAGDRLLGWALIGGLAAYFVQFLGRGTLAGNARFRPYAVLVGGEGILRVVFCAGGALIGAVTPGPYGVIMVLASFVAAALALGGRRGLLRHGPPAAWSEISSALGFLLIASVMTQFLLSVGTVAVQLLATPAQHAAAGRFLTSRIMAYVPLFLFQAVQFTLLPKLAALAGARRYDDFVRTLRQILAVVAVVGVASVLAISLLGPWATRLLFGRGFELGTLDFVLLSASCAGFMLAQVMSQALISLRGFARVAVGWLIGATAFVVVTALGTQLFLRVELGLVVAAVACCGVMTAELFPLLRSRLAEPAGTRVTAHAALP